MISCKAISTVSVLVPHWRLAGKAGTPNSHMITRKRFRFLKPSPRRPRTLEPSLLSEIKLCGISVFGCFVNASVLREACVGVDPPKAAWADECRPAMGQSAFRVEALQKSRAVHL